MILITAVVFIALGFAGGFIVAKCGYLDRVIDLDKFGL
jgi:uncharacterized membrane protein